jgi:nicotinamidase-related amidase
MSTPALLVIDVQKAIDDPVWGRRGQPGMEGTIAGLLSAWRSRGLPVIHVRHDSTEANSPYRPGASGNDFKPEVAPVQGESVVGKRTNSAFIGTDLMDVLAALRVGQIVMTGVLLENSVEATAWMAGNLGFDVVIPRDAVASIDRTDINGRLWPAEDVHALTLAILDKEYARISSAAAVIEALP